LQMKHRYSGKVRLFGYCIIVFELLVTAVWIAVNYDEGMILYSFQQSTFSHSNGNSIGFVNSTSGETLTLPITGAGFFATTISAGLSILNSQNQTVSQLQSSVTVSPGETKDLSLTVPSSVVASAKNSTYYLHITFTISSLSGLVGLGANVELNTCAFSGGCKK